MTLHYNRLFTYMQHVGQLLRNARIKKGISLEEIEKKTRIRKKHLQSIEDSKWSDFSSSTYITGILTAYASYVSLNPETIIAFFRREYELDTSIKFKSRLFPSSLFPLKRRIILILSVLFVIIFGSYFIYQLFVYMKPPTYNIIQPTTSIIITRSPTLTLVMSAEKESIVSINNKRIYPNDKMIFTITIPFIEEKATANIEVIGANGKRVKKTHTYIRQRP